MPVTTRQIKLLAPYLEGDKPTHIHKDGTREWNLVCPLHDDTRRSASLNIDKGLFYCNVCGGMPVTALIRRHDEWHAAGASNGRVSSPDLNAHPEGKERRVLTDGMLGGWHSRLKSDESALRWLKERRGLTLETVKLYEIGWDGRLYTIPVRGPEREIWNVRYYNPNPAGKSRKIWSESGYGSPPRLYPMQVFGWDPTEVIIGGGEWDVLLTLQNSYDAITRTAGEDYWDAAWAELFKDKIVYLAHDRDEKGSKADRIVGMQLDKICDVRQIELPYPFVEKHGQDLTDFFLDHKPGEFRKLMDDAKPFGRKRRQSAKQDDIPLVTVLDAFDGGRVGDPIRIVTTIKGRKEPGYVIPQKVHLVCTRDAGNKCLSCALNAMSGEATVDIAPDDPMILAMMDADTTRMHQAISEAFGIAGGRCAKLKQEVDEYQSVEVLFGRPALDYHDGSQGEYKNIKVTSVGHHDTIANNTITFTGALQPNPRSQTNEFLAHSLEIMETSVDRFTIGVKSVQMMKRFQTKDGQRPIKKMSEISHALSDHVTKIKGRPEMHALMDLTFHSVLGFNFAGETVVKGWLDTIILGDTGTGKSTAATRLVQHYGAGELVSCESSSFAGVVGGLQQMGGKDWAVTWGAIPINDKRIVFLDEVSGLKPEEIAAMSDIRSSGQAKLTKIQQEVTWARTRLVWMGNPRGQTMDHFTYGVDAMKPLIGNAEDIARFDLAMAATKDDVPIETFNQRHTSGELRYTEDACHTLLMWAWTRQPDQVVWARGAEEKVFDGANELGRMYTEDPPLILASSIRIKIARVSVAIAARLFSTDEKTHETIVVKKEHVEDAISFINILYGMPTFGYRARSQEILADKYEAESNRDQTLQYLKGRPMLVKHLRTAGKFRRQDLEELMNISREDANGIINTLYEHRMVRRHLGDIYVEPTLHSLLRSIKI